MSVVYYPAQMRYACVILGPDGNEYYDAGEQDPFLITPADVPIIPMEPEVIVISDDEDDAPEATVEAVEAAVEQALGQRAAAKKCTALMKEFFTTLELYGEEF